MVGNMNDWFDQRPSFSLLHAFNPADDFLRNVRRPQIILIALFLRIQRPIAHKWFFLDLLLDSKSSWDQLLSSIITNGDQERNQLGLMSFFVYYD